MINKRRSFADSNVALACKVSFRKACSLEKALMAWAFDYSVYHERPTPWVEVEELYLCIISKGYKPSEDNFKSFARACRVAHRVESSLVVAKGMDTRFFVKNPLTLRIKFYNKDDRKEFFCWYMTFSEMGRIHRSGMTGHGKIGEKIMA
jgi:hypothetical protein